jgi:hypothetical protein
MTSLHKTPDGASLSADNHVTNYITEPSVYMATESGGCVITACHVAKGTGKTARDGSKAQRAALIKNSGQIWAAARGVADLVVVREKSPLENQISRFGVPKEKYDGGAIPDFNIEMDRVTRRLSVSIEEVKTPGQDRYAKFREKVNDSGDEGVTRTDMIAYLGCGDDTVDKHAKFGEAQGHIRIEKSRGKATRYFRGSTE